MQLRETIGTRNEPSRQSKDPLKIEAARLNQILEQLKIAYPGQKELGERKRDPRFQATWSSTVAQIRAIQEERSTRRL